MQIDWAVLVAALGPYAIGVTKAVDFLRNFLQAHVPDLYRKWDSWKYSWNLTAFLFGVGAAYLGDVNVPAAIQQHAPVVWQAKLLTGIGIGAVAAAWHEGFDFLSSSAKRARGVNVEAPAAEKVVVQTGTVNEAAPKRSTTKTRRTKK